jgi:hypothetical protein
MADEGLDEIARELYAVDPARFVAARTEAVQRARATGDRALVTAVGRLRRPTLSAWAMNLLARAVPAELTELATLGEELRAAQWQLQAAQLRQVNQRRRELIGTLSRRARQLAADAGHALGGAAVAEVEQTLAAAVADPESAQAVCSGRLTRPLQHIGLGTEPLLPAAEPAHPPAAPASPVPSSPPSPSRAEDDLARQRRRREERLARDLARADQELEAAVARAAHAEQEVRQAAQRCADLDRRLAQRRAQSAARVRDDAQRRVLRLTEEHKAAR